MTTIDPFERSRAHRDRVYAARNAMARTFRAFAPHDSAADCGKVRGAVQLDNHGGTWHATGFETCAIHAMCPHCSIAPRLRRRVEIALAVQRWMAAGGTVAMITYALPHGPLDPLKVTFERLRQSWQRALDTQPGRRWRRNIRLRHLVKATEVTFHRDRGRHPHMHVLLFLDVDIDEFCDPEYGQRIWALSMPLWHASLAEGRDRPFVPSVGYDITLVRDPFAADYLSKIAGDEQGVGAEVVQLGHQKDGRNGSISAMAIPYAIAQAGPNPRKSAEADPHVAWLIRCLLEYRKATWGQSLLTYSKRLRSELLPDLEDLSDDELVRMGHRLRGEYRATHPALEGAGEATVEVEQASDEGDADDPGDEEDERPRGATITADAWTTWARTLPPGPLPAPAVACRRIEHAGVWRWLLDVACAVDEVLNVELQVWWHPRRRRLHVATSALDIPPGYVEVPADEWLDLAEGTAPLAA